jgi:carbamate kinase
VADTKQSGTTVVVALGGNAIIQPGQVGTFEEQLVNCDDTARRIARMVAAGHRVVVTHGNGPQVGNILIQQEAASKAIAPMPMDVCGAQSQGQIGYMLEQCLHNHLVRGRIDMPVVTLLSETLVDTTDPAFQRPSKPVGPFYSATKAKELSLEKGYAMKEDAGRGWRRVVPSPQPQEIVQRATIARLVADGALVVCSGGGGIPVYRGRDGTLHGVEAVIDKDLAAARLAQDVGADVLMILTDVPHIYLHYRQPDQIALDKVDWQQMQRYADEGHFKAGSMGPKVQAAIGFARAGGTAIIAGLLDALPALEGTAGTWVVPVAAGDRARRPAVSRRPPARG